MQIPQFHHATYLAQNEWFHFARTILPTQRPHTQHGQDYHEVFWIQHGQARHLINDQAVTLEEGDVVFVRPCDRHALQGMGTETWLVNILFHPDIITAFADRHPDVACRFLTHPGPLPTQLHRDMRQLADLSRAALRLETGPRSALRIEAFLLWLMAELDEATADIPASAPDWLARACTAAEKREVFAQGAAGLVAAAGRQHAHVSRVCRAVLGQTPTEYINAIRMDYAARQLSGSTDSLTEIALDCGIENLSHFHRLFKARHGMPPKAWRRRYQRSVIQPI
ncbi:MAG: helix-turn-helix transcriptional regulator [Pseudomonadota bacterium]